MPDTHIKAHEHFKRGREERNLSISDVANALRLNITVIEQIENGDFSDRRFAPVFMRGYIRSYAKYLSLPEETVHQIIDILDIAQPRSTEALKLQPTIKKQAPMKRIKTLFSYIVVVILLIILAVLWHHRHNINHALTENTENITLVNDNDAENAPLKEASEEQTMANPEEPVALATPNSTVTDQSITPITTPDTSAIKTNNTTPLEEPLNSNAQTIDAPSTTTTSAPKTTSNTTAVTSKSTTPTSSSSSSNPIVVDAEETP